MATCLTNTGVVFPDATTQTTAAAAVTLNVQSFTSSGTWTCPTGARLVTIEIYGTGGGGGGGGGTRYPNSPGGTGTVGGAGGGGGGYFCVVCPAPSLGSTQPVTVGAGGSGGGGASTPAYNPTYGGGQGFGTCGTPGGITCVGGAGTTWIVPGAGGGGGGCGVQGAGSSNPGPAGVWGCGQSLCHEAGGRGGGNRYSTGPQPNLNECGFGSLLGGGGGGAGCGTPGSARAGGNRGVNPSVVGGGGAAPGNAGSAGGAGCGGGGGGNPLGSAGCAGGAGGVFGGGGGGGSSATPTPTPNSGGSGGAGGTGCVVITSI